MNRRIVAFCCDNSAYQAADMCGYMGMELPSNIELTRVPCLGSIEPAEILKSYEEGAEGILVLGCHEGSCRHMRGSGRIGGRLSEIKQVLTVCGIPGESIELQFITANRAAMCVRVMKDFADRINRLYEKAPARS